MVISPPSICSFDFGFVFGGKYHLNSQMALIGTYYLGLGEINEDVDTTNRGFQFNISFKL
mgnify:CR=1 FL=1